MSSVDVGTAQFLAIRRSQAVCRCSVLPVDEHGTPKLCAWAQGPIARLAAD